MCLRPLSQRYGYYLAHETVPGSRLAKNIAIKHSHENEICTLCLKPRGFIMTPKEISIYDSVSILSILAVKTRHTGFKEKKACLLNSRMLHQCKGLRNV